MADFAPADVYAEIDRQAGNFGVNPSYAKALAAAENTGSGDAVSRTSWSGDAISSAKAKGIMQVLPSTAVGLQKAGLLSADWKSDPDNLSSQVSAGLATIKDMMQRMKNPNDPYELASLYNGGTGAGKNYAAGNISSLPEETKLYLPKVRKALMDLGVATPPNTTVPSTPQFNSGVSSSGTTRRIVSDPLSMEMFTNQAFDIASPGGEADQNAANVIQQGEARNTAAQQLQKAIAEKGVAAAAEAGAQATMDASAAARRAAILTSMNLNPDMVDNAMTRAAGVINSTDAMLNSLKPDIDKRMSVGFFDNPIEWLINEVRLPGMVSQYNSTVGTQNNAIDTYKNLSSIASTQQTISQAMDADLILRKGVETKAKIAADANAELAKSQEAAAAANSRDTLVLSHLAGTKLDAAGKLVSATKVTVSESEAAREKLNAQQQLQFDLDKANNLIKAAGGDGFSLAAFKSMPAKEREEILTRSSKGVFGKDFGDSFAFQDAVGNRRQMAVNGAAASTVWMDKTTKDAADQVNLAVAQQEKTTGKQMTLKQKEEMMPTALNHVQALYENQQQKDMRTASDSNPYKLDYTTIAKEPVLANNPLAIFLNKYGPAGSDAAFSTVDERHLLDRFAFSVSAGTMPVQDATKAITDFYKVGIQKQAMATAYPLYGLAPAKGYNVVIPQTSFFSTPVVTGTLDLTNPVKVENYLVRSVAARAARTAPAVGVEQNPMMINFGG